MAMKQDRGKAKPRNTGTRQRKSIFLFAAEGNNVTETNYFRQFQSDQIQIRFTKGNETDPVKLMNRLIDEYRELSPLPGDKAFCLIDGDVDPNKDIQIAKADKLAKGTAAKQIVSNPCFEIWFLNHFGFTMKQFQSSAGVVSELMRHIPTYTKNSKNLYSETIDKIDTAIDSSKRQIAEARFVGKKPHTSDYQPTTEVCSVIEDLLKRSK